MIVVDLKSSLKHPTTQTFSKSHVILRVCIDISLQSTFKILFELGIVEFSVAW